MASRTIADTASQLFPENGLRRSFVVQNEDTTINIFIKREAPNGLTVSTTDHDHRLGAGGSIALNYQNDGESAIKDRWTIIAASGTPLVSFFETESIKR